MRCFLFLLGFTAQAFGAGLGSYSHLVVSDSARTARDGVRVTYIGTNGYQFECGGHALLVDPYFSRVDLLSVALGSRIQPNASRINDGLRHLTPKADAILVTHGHFDHLLDVPVVMAKTRARLIASPSSVDLAKRAGASSGDAVKPGAVRRIGPWKIHVLPATHDRLFGKVPFDEAHSQTVPPQHAADWICGEPLAFLIEVNGQRIYIDSGGTPAQLPPNERVELAILGMALPDSRARLAAALAHLKPRYVLPSHQDDFFRPLSAGFQFGSLTDFPFVQRACAQQNRGRLILLDYFRPWTLPAAVNPKSQKGLITDQTLECANVSAFSTLRGSPRCGRKINCRAGASPARASGALALQRVRSAVFGSGLPPLNNYSFIIRAIRVIRGLITLC